MFPKTTVSTLLLWTGVVQHVSGQRNVDPDFGMDEPFYCEKTGDCWDGDEYCLQGVCAPFGMCLTDQDCFNPYNDGNYADTKCVGYVYCDTELQSCARKCGAGPCANGSTETMCVSKNSGCDNYTGLPPAGATLCVNNACDNCSAIWYNAMGFTVPDGITMVDDQPVYQEEDDELDPEFGVTPIEVDEIDPEFGVTPIERPEAIDPGFGVDAPIDPGFGVDPGGPSQDCMSGVCPSGDGAYCDEEGNCLLLGKCTTKDDCFSIYNDPYPVSMCIGDIICHNGLCVADCDPILEEFDCSNKDNAPNVVEVVCKDMELSTLCAALTDTSKNKDVNKWLTDPKKRHTVFAPTDAAFAALPKNYDANLKFHIAKGRASFARDLSCVAGNNLVTMSNGKDTRTKCKEEVPYIQQGKGNTEMDLYPEFIESDIIACNGLIHKISNVMLLNPKN